MEQMTLFKIVYHTVASLSRLSLRLVTHSLITSDPVKILSISYHSVWLITRIYVRHQIIYFRVTSVPPVNTWRFMRGWWSEPQWRTARKPRVSHLSSMRRAMGENGRTLTLGTLAFRYSEFPTQWRRVRTNGGAQGICIIPARVRDLGDIRDTRKVESLTWPYSAKGHASFEWHDGKENHGA